MIHCFETDAHRDSSGVITITEGRQIGLSVPPWEMLAGGLSRACHVKRPVEELTDNISNTSLGNVSRSQSPSDSTWSMVVSFREDLPLAAFGNTDSLGAASALNGLSIQNKKKTVSTPKRGRAPSVNGNACQNCTSRVRLEVPVEVLGSAHHARPLTGSRSSSRSSSSTIPVSKRSILNRTHVCYMACRPACIS